MVGILMSNISSTLKHVLIKCYGNKSDEYIQIIKLLKSNSFEICLLNLPINIEYENNPNDLDITIDQKYYEKCIKFLKNIGFSSKGMLIESNQVVLSKVSNRNDYLINFHIHKDIYFHGIKLLDFKTVINESNMIDDQIFYPNQALEREILIYESFFRKKPNYKIRISKLKRSRYIYTKNKLLFKYIEFCMSKNIYNRFVRYLTIFTSLRFMFQFIKYLYRYSEDFLKRFFTKKGKIVIYLGVDGSGKTTQCEKVKSSLKYRGINAESVYLGLKSTVPQIIKSYFFKDNYHLNKNSKNITGKLLPSLKNNILDLVYLVNYFILYRLSCLKLRSSTDVLLVDRSYYDLVHRLNFVTRHMYRFFLPLPDFIFFLDGSLQDIARRKGEHSTEELDHMRANLECVVSFIDKKNTKYIKINTTSKSVDDVTKESVRYILNAL
jgi:thymidylate kinase